MQLRNLRCAEVAHVFDELAYVATEKNIISRGRKQVNFANELRIKTMQTLWWTQPQVCWVERVLEKNWRGLARGNHRFVHMVNRHLVAYVPSTNLCPEHHGALFGVANVMALWTYKAEVPSSS